MEIYRELAAAYPDRYRPDLARSLSNLGIPFSELGRPAEALPVTQEAVAIRRELAAAYPDRYRPDLARSLSNLGIRFSAAGPSRRGAAGDPGGGRCSTGSWPRPTPTGTGPTWPPRCPTSASGSRSWAVPAEALPVTQEAVADLPGAGRGRPRPVPARPGRLADQPRRLVLGGGPSLRPPARDPGGGRCLPGAGRRRP